MFYADTSIVAAYYCTEEKSQDVENLITGTEDVAVSMPTELEFHSALSRKVREKAITVWEFP
ncbi:MAG: type II toxin-antitoxin system VapC family toxin [Lentisphaerota bacterium]